MLLTENQLGLLHLLDLSSIRVTEIRAAQGSLFRTTRQIPESIWQQLEKEVKQCNSLEQQNSPYSSSTNSARIATESP